ncbi:hypothetical protein AVEN_187425-1 [Araneus ventricosus]|nr:hypothetical protein AVEN_53990-1 [Araneus ventricosus]GBN25173.1 hypothetical protein AVEN_187425-1 [Araneus ventricosus]
MPAEKALVRICNMWSCSVLHDNCATHTCTLLKCWNDMVAQKRFIIGGTGNTTRRTYLFEKEWPCDKRCLKSSPHSYFFRTKRYWLTSGRIFRCQYFAIPSADIYMDMKMSFICPKNVSSFLILHILT